MLPNNVEMHSSPDTLTLTHSWGAYVIYNKLKFMVSTQPPQHDHKYVYNVDLDFRIRFGWLWLLTRKELSHTSEY